MSEGLHFKFKEEHYPNDKFFPWLKSNTALFLGQLAAIASVILFVASFAYYVLGFHAGESHTTIDEYLDLTKQVVFILNIVFCFLFIIFSGHIIYDNKTGHYHSRQFLKLCFGVDESAKLKDAAKHTLTEREILAEKLLIQFKYNFLGYWCYLFLFYSFMASYVGKKYVGEVPIEIITTAFNGFLFVLPYRMFSIITRAKFYLRESLHDSKSIKWIDRLLTGKAFPFIIYIALLGVYIYFIPSANNTNTFIRISTAISSSINLVSLGLLISRLDSKLIGLPSWLICIVFIYAAIQPLDIFLDEKTLESKMFSVFSYVIVLIFKIYFFFIITYLLQTGRLLSYLQSNGILSDRMSRVRKWSFRFNNWQLFWLLFIVGVLQWAYQNILDLNPVIDALNASLCLIAFIWIWRNITSNLKNSSDADIKQAISNEKEKVFSMVHKHRHHAHNGHNNDEAQPLNFYRWLLWFFVVTGLLYITLYIEHQNESDLKNNTYLKTLCKGLSQLLNTGSALMLFFSFVELYLPSVTTEKRLGKRLKIYGCFFLIAITAIGTISYFNHKNYFEFKSGDLLPCELRAINSDSVFVYKFDYDQPFNSYVAPDQHHYQSTKNNSGNGHSKENSEEPLYIKGLLMYNSHPLTKYRKSDTNQLLFKKREPVKYQLNINPYFNNTIVQLNHEYKHLYFEYNDQKAKQVGFSVSDSTNSKMTVNLDTGFLKVSHSGPLLSDTVLLLKEKLVLATNYLAKNEPLKLPSFISIISKRSNDWLINIFNAISGIICAVVLCLFISRLDSKFIGLPNWIIALLFLYAAIQVFFSIFNMDDAEFGIFVTLTMCIALLLKMVFFFIIINLFSSKNIYHYFVLFKELDWRADAAFANQFEFVTYKIHDSNKYSFYINHEMHKVINIDHRFETFEECTAYIMALRNGISQDNQRIFKHDVDKGEAFGVYRLTGKFQDKTLFSKDFKNLEDFEVFTHEINHQLPYCKVNLMI